MPNERTDNPLGSLKPSPYIEGEKGYAPPVHPAPISLKLDANEAPQPPAHVLDAMRDPAVQVNRYISPKGLEARLAESFGVEPARVLVTAGADDAIMRACLAFLPIEREMLIPVPAFEMFPICSRLAGGRMVGVNWTEGAFPLSRMLEAITPETALIVVVSPDNPTGLIASPDDFERLCKAAPQAVVLLDAAYGPFCDSDLTGVALKQPNAVVLQTFSKAWGLAGLRVGLAVGAAKPIEWMRRAGGPYPVSAASLAAAHASLDNPAYGLRYIETVKQERNALSERLSRYDCDPMPSQANFVFARPADAAWFTDAMAGMGVGVRRFDPNGEFAGGVRISCPGNSADLATLLNALDIIHRPEALLFDMDGVLADVSESYRRAIIDSAACFGVKLTPEDIARAKAEGSANDDWELTRRLIERGGGKASLEEAKAEFEARYQGGNGQPGLWTLETPIFSVDALKRLAARLPLAVVTGRPRADAERFLRHFELEGLFKAVVCREDCPLMKPDPAPVHEALARLGVRRAWMLGDTPDDIRAARAAGVLPLGYIAPGDNPELISRGLLEHGAARVLSDTTELERILP